MPKLDFFLVCERVIRNGDDNTLSLITIIEGVQVPKPQDPNAAVAIRWTAIANWKKDEQDADKTFEQRTFLALPDGTETSSAEIKFTMKDPYQRNVVTTFGFPVSQAGIYKLKLYLREQGNENWNEISEYPIPVTYLEEKK